MQSPGDSLHGEQATQWLGRPGAELDEQARAVTQHLAARRHIARDLTPEFDAPPRFGQRAADRVAAFGGSWTFVGLFAGSVAVWVALNGVLMLRQGHAFDPYPYILLNLFLSMLAAIQAPVILMSQNRQAEKDRLSAKHDYEVNLKAELEIMLLHEKLDALRRTQWDELLLLQREQLSMLARLSSGGLAAGPFMPAPGPTGPAPP